MIRSHAVVTLAAASPSLTSYRIEFNVGNGERAKTPLGQNAKVRQAFDAAIDRAVINQVVFDGQYIPGNQSVPPGNRFYIKSLPVPPRDLPRAKALMKEAGIDRLKVRMTVPNTNDYVQPAQVIQAMAMSLLLSDLPTVYLFHPMLIYAMKDSLEGFTPVPDGMIRLAGMRRLR